MRKKKWLMIAVVCTLAVCVTGCASRKGHKADTRGILRTRNMVPAPYASPESVRGVTPAPTPAPATQGLVTPSTPQQLVQDPATPQEPALPLESMYVPPTAPAVPTTQPVATFTSVFKGNEPQLNGNPQYVAVSTTGTSPAIASPAKPAPTFKPASVSTSKPAATSKATIQAIPANGKYTAKSGDTLWSISKTYGINFLDIQKWNPEAAKLLKPNMVINLKAPANTPAAKPATSSKSATSTKAAPAVSKKPAASKGTHKPIPEDGKYTIKAGDNPWTIARTYGINHKDLLDWNPTMDPNKLQINQVITLKNPNGKSPAPAPVSKKEAAKPQAAPQAKNAAGAEAAKPAQTAIAPAVVNITPENNGNTAAAAPAQTTGTAQNENITTLDHTVAVGDTLEKIATMYGSSVELIKAHNPTVQSDSDLANVKTLKVPFPTVTP